MWVGWYKATPTAAWERLVEDEDLARCHHRLLVATPVDAPSLHRCLTTGSVPITQRPMTTNRDSVMASPMPPREEAATEVDGGSTPAR
jgi:hypothetical protein